MIATPVTAVTTTPVGGAASLAAVAIGVAAGGIGALNTLRDKYKIVEEDEDHIKLKRK